MKMKKRNEIARAIKTALTVTFLLLNGFMPLPGSDSNSNPFPSIPEKGIFSPCSTIHIPIMQSKSAPAKRTATIMPNGVSIPADFPRVYISVNNDSSEGYIFLNNWRDYHPFNMILDNYGSPIWYLRTPNNDRRRDFKVQNNGWLTMLIWLGYEDGLAHIALDQNYNYIKTFRTTSGYRTDEHELQVLEDGGYLLIATKDSTVDMSQYVDGGSAHATIRESVIQEFTTDDSLIYQWRAWGHFDIRDVHSTEDPLTDSLIRFPHMNAIDIDYDGNVLLSSRHLSEVTKIDRQTREIIWRLGGAHSDFKFIGDSFNGFSMQHDIRHVPGQPNHYTVFDNGNWHNPQISRAVEYALDLNDSTATLVWEFRETPDYYSHYMGNVQRLPNGNTFINWATNKFSEVRPNGEKAFEMAFLDGYDCYRAFRFPWNGMSLVPYLIVESHRESVALIFNKFGDPDVDYYRIYGGTSPNPTALLDTSKVTLKALTNLQNLTQYYFRVTAVDIYGQESGYSNEENTMTNFINPGSNMVRNGSFSSHEANWTFISQPPASADWSVEDGVSHISISQGGNSIDQILLVQDGMEAIRGEQYLFEFDAWSDVQRTIEAVIIQYGGQFTNYSRTGPSLLTTKPIHYSYPFTMEDPSDFNAYLAFLMGTSNGDVYLDNISFKHVIKSDVSESADRTPLQYNLRGNYPNPFNAQTSICFSVPQTSRVRIDLYNILGKFEKKICNTIYDQGEYQIKFDGNRLGSGIYFCTMKAEGIEDNQIYRNVHKMILIK
jgi:hypothetical protein